ncbi:MAG: MucB/RseB C-terminal domain-containing protein [Gammaproteobacteria bacterium]
MSLTEFSVGTTMTRIRIHLWYRVLIVVLGMVQPFDVLSEGKPEQSAKQLLLEMAEAVKMKSYRGTVVYLRDNKAETMRVFHAQQGGVEHERIVTLNSPMREVVRSDKDVTCYLPDAHLVYVTRQTAHRSFLVQVPDNVDVDSPLYEFLLGNREYVIQKDTRVIELRPKDEFRYGRKIWIDSETRLPLKYELLDEQGESVEQMMFTDLEVVDQLPESALEVSPDIKSSDSSWEVRDEQSFMDVKKIWTFGNLPEGFKEIFHRRSIMPTDKQAVEHILFSDGFSSVSVYVDKLGVDDVPPYHKKWGAINSYSRLFGGYQVTVLGAVPDKTVVTIGNGISFLEEPGK